MKTLWHNYSFLRVPQPDFQRPLSIGLKKVYQSIIVISLPQTLTLLP